MTTVTAPLPASGSARTVARDVQKHVAATGAHVIETELRRPAPRKVRFTKNAYRKLLWCVNLGIGVVLGWVWIGSFQATPTYFYKSAVTLASLGFIVLHGVWRNNEKIRHWFANGDPVAGLVVERKHDVINRPTEYVVVFEALLSPESVTRHQAVVGEAKYEALEPGTVVTLVRHPVLRDVAQPYFLFTNVEVG